MSQSTLEKENGRNWFERHSNLMRLKPQRYSMSRTLKETGFLLSEVITISLEKHGLSHKCKNKLREKERNYYYEKL